MLLYKTTEESTGLQSRSDSSFPPSHWIVVVSDQGEEEDISERMLGRVLVDNNNNGSTVAAESDSSSTMAALVDAIVAKPIVAAVSTTKKRLAQNNKALNAAGSKATTKAAACAASKNIKATIASSGRVHSTRAVTRSSGPSVELLRGIEEYVLPPKPRAAVAVTKGSSGGDTANLVKVKLLTGTLYLYRGPKKYVKFVRTK
jgi:hypothetical protein